MKDKNGQRLKIGDQVIHVANPTVKGTIRKISIDVPNYLGSCWVDVDFEKPVSFSGNPGRTAVDWTCSSKLLEKRIKHDEKKECFNKNRVRLGT